MREEAIPAVGRGEARTVEASKATVPLRVALVYDLDGCHWPTGVTRHALAQLERLARRPEVALTLVAGRMTEPDGLAYWETLGALPRRELPIRMRHVLRWWRLASGPPWSSGRGRWTGRTAPPNTAWRPALPAAR